MSFLAELKRRRVIRVMAAYLIIAWAAIQVTDTVAPRIGLPDWTVTLIIFLVALGLPTIVILAWVFDVGPGGIQRTQPSAGATTSRARYAAFAAIVAVAGLGAYVGWQRYGTSESGALESVAVLPFTNMSGDVAQEPFADGISEEILNALAQVEGLSVAARTSAFAFKNTKEDVRDIARKLGVAAVLEGSVRKQGEKLRITAQLINASNGYHLWSNTFDRSASDIFAVQDEIARAIVDALKIEMAGGAGPEVARGGTTNLTAHELYLLGLHHFARRTAQDMTRAIEVLNQAIAADSSYALAYGGLASVYAAAPYYIDLPIAEAAKRGRAAAMKALALDSTVAEAYAALGDIAFHADWDMQASEQLLRRAIALKPSYMQAYNWLAEPLIATGRHSDALAASKRALELDPLSLRANKTYGWQLFSAGQGEAGLVYLQRALQSDSTNQATIVDLAIANLGLGHLPQAAAHLRRYAGLIGPVAEPIDLAARALLEPSLRPAAVRELVQVSSSPWLPAGFLLPQLYLTFGAKEKALDYFERKYAEHDYSLPFAFYDITLIELRNEPRFRALAEKVGIKLPPANAGTGTT